MEEFSSIKKGQVVRAEVFAHFPFGIFAKIEGLHTLGLIHFTHISKAKNLPYEKWPRIGTIVTATIIGWRSDPTPEIYLSLLDNLSGSELG